MRVSFRKPKLVCYRWASASASPVVPSVTKNMQLAAMPRWLPKTAAVYYSTRVLKQRLTVLKSDEYASLMGASSFEQS